MVDEVWGDPDAPRDAKWRGLVRIIEQERQSGARKYYVEIWRGYNGAHDGWILATSEAALPDAQKRAEDYFAKVLKKRSPDPVVSSSVIEQ